MKNKRRISPPAEARSIPIRRRLVRQRPACFFFTLV
nr:MAG TPA: hypothetical protein [Caudoviricetes sp.]